METLNIPEREEECFLRLSRLINRLETPTPMILDVGANIGQSIEKFKHEWPDSQIHSFEPNPSTFLTLSSMWSEVTGVFPSNIALTDTIGNVPFYATRISELASLLPPSERMQFLSSENKYDFESLNIEADTLDNYCRKSDISKIDLLKIDVQGAELSVLKGAQSMLKNNTISIIYVESIFADCYDSQTNFTDLLNFLNGSLGYQLWDVQPFVYTKQDRLWATNSIFLSPLLTSRFEDM